MAHRNLHPPKALSWMSFLMLLSHLKRGRAPDLLPLKRSGRYLTFYCNNVFCNSEQFQLEIVATGTAASRSFSVVSVRVFLGNSDRVQSAKCSRAFNLQKWRRGGGRKGEKGSAQSQLLLHKVSLFKPDACMPSCPHCLSPCLPINILTGCFSFIATNHFKQRTMSAEC